MMVRVFLVGAALCALCGCTPEVLRFQPGPKMAKLRYVTTALPSDQTYFLRVDTQSCPAAPGTQLLAYTGTGPNDTADALVQDLYIPTDAPFVFRLRANRQMKYDCDNAGVFKPEPAHDYELRYVIEPRTFVCIVQLDELRESQRSRETTAHFFYPPKQAAEFCNATVRKEHE